MRIQDPAGARLSVTIRSGFEIIRPPGYIVLWPKWRSGLASGPIPRAAPLRVYCGGLAALLLVPLILLDGGGASAGTTATACRLDRPAAAGVRPARLSELNFGAPAGGQRMLTEAFHRGDRPSGKVHAAGMTERGYCSPAGRGPGLTR